jgi:ComF family protein
MLLQQLTQVLLPRNCVFCGTRCAIHLPHICCGCLDDLPWRAALLTEGEPPFEVAAALFEYAFPVDAALKALKFRRRLDYVPAFATLLARVFPELPDDIDALLPVPLHWRRHAQRGFNQALELCRELESSTGLPIRCNIKRIRATPYQSGLEAEARSANLRAAFAARSHLSSRHVLLVDDVITTGATCRELASAALAAGAAKVSVLAVART